MELRTLLQKFEIQTFLSNFYYIWKFGAIWYICVPYKPMSYIGLSKLPHNRFISLGANFPKWWALSFSRNFPNLKIHDPKNRKTHVTFHTQSLGMYMSIWTPVIDEMLVCKLAQYSQSVYSSDKVLCGQTLKRTGLLSLAV